MPFFRTVKIPDTAFKITPPPMHRPLLLYSNLISTFADVKLSQISFFMANSEKTPWWKLLLQAISYAITLIIGGAGGAAMF